MSATPAGRAIRVGFAGTPEFARQALQSICDAGFEVPLVLTQPDRPAGRGMKLQASAVKQLAQALGLSLAQPRSLRLDGKFPDDAAAARHALQSARLDVLVVAAYGLILPPWVLALPAHGCLNIHGSMLPRWRGAAPIQRAIEAGDAETGITIMQMDAGLDTGTMLLRENTTITPDDTAATLHDKLAVQGARLVVQALQRLGTLPATPQPAHGATYASKIEKAEGAIHWSEPADTIERRVRAFDPFPGCSLVLDGETLKLWRARRAADITTPARPGTVLQAGEGRLVVACGDGALELLEIQPSGGRRMAVRDFLHARPLAAGTRLGSPGGA